MASSLSQDILERLDDIAQLLSIEVRSKFETQVEAILAMSAAGMSHRRIAQLLGTSANTVNVAVSRAKSRRR